MYARIARFEGGTASAIEEETQKIHGDLKAAQRGETGGYMPELNSLVSRVEVFADRGEGRVAVIVYCDTEDQLHEADRVLAAMSPQNPDWGHRVSSDTYEVIADESAQVRSAA